MESRKTSRPPERMPPPIKREPSVTDEDPVNGRILALVSDLGNTVLTKRAASDLVK